MQEATIVKPSCASFFSYFDIIWIVSTFYIAF
jgi:hypothetical protein